MDVKINEKSQTKKELEVVISKEEMEAYLDKAAKNISAEMNIKGFRPGNAPRDVVENTAGKEKLWEDAAKEAIQETYPKIIEENNLFAIAQPQVELIKCAPENDVVYKAQVYVMPEIKLPDYKKIGQSAAKEEKKEIGVEEKEIEDTLEKIKESRAKTQKVDRGAKKGDTVVINFQGTFQENTDKKIEEKDFKVNLGKGELNVLQGFEEQLYGMKEGEKKDFSLKTPVSQSSEQNVNFNVEMVSVMERILPEIDDDFAGSFPNIENVAQLKEKIKQGIKADKEAKQTEKVRMKVLEEIRKETDLEVPEVLAEKELDNIINNIKNQVKNSGVSFEDYLKETGKSEEELRKEWREKAEENVAYALLLHAIGKEEKIEANEEEVEAEIDRYFQTAGEGKENEENMEKMRAHVYDVIRNQKVFRALLGE